MKSGGDTDPGLTPGFRQDTAAQPRSGIAACPRDTDRDGDCGQRACQLCYPQHAAVVRMYDRCDGCNFEFSAETGPAKQTIFGLWTAVERVRHYCANCAPRIYD